MVNIIKNVGQRIQLFIEGQNLSNNKFGNKVGLSGSIISHMVNGNNFGIDKLIKIMNSYPLLNIEWILTGNGDMFKSKLVGETVGLSENSERGVEDNTTHKLLELENKHLKEQLKLKEQELDSMTSHNKALQEIIVGMKK